MLTTRAGRAVRAPDVPRRPGIHRRRVATLALGIGANAAIFSVANAVLLQRLPFESRPAGDGLGGRADMGFPRNTRRQRNYCDVKTSMPAFEDAAALS